MKKSLCLVLFLVCFVGLASAAQADFANFQAKCTWNSGNTAFTCNFNGQLPSSSPSYCTNGTAPEYKWTFDVDNASSTTTGYGTSSTTSHTYAPPPIGEYGYHAKLKIRCFENIGSYSYAEETRYICVFGFATHGCIPVNGNWN